MRIAHYVVSTHWDREWYESLQSYRMRLVSLLDETLELMGRDPAFKPFVMDGQTIPVFDYLEIRPEKRGQIRQLAEAGKFKVGPWYVLPDEWLVSGESLVRNLQMGMRLAGEFGAPPSRAGFACDLFGHVGQLPQIFEQLGIPGAVIWRGTNLADVPAYLNWTAPDGTSLPTHRFPWNGYCTVAFDVRKAQHPDRPFVLDEMARLLVDATLAEAKRATLSPILLFDGADHIEPEPQTPAMIAKANEQLAARGIKIVQSDLDAFTADYLKERSKIDFEIRGELRATGRDPMEKDAHWLIPGVLSSRIHLKQRNAACEDELALWAEPFSAFATARLGTEYPLGYLRTAWKHLIENHPHDSICGCSIDQVHQDMIYRFDQSLGISTLLSRAAMKSITAAATSKDLAADALVLGLFNPTAEAIDEPLDIEVPLPAGWAKKFQEFFGFEEKFSFKLRGPDGQEIPYQLVAQRRDVARIRRPRYKFPATDPRHVVTVTAQVRVPAFGYTSIVVEPVDGPTRYHGSLLTAHHTMENEHLAVKVNANGTIDLTDKRSGKTFSQLLAFEQRADIGDGWFHGIAVNDQVFNSAACSADVAVVADGIGKCTFRITVTMNVPAEFDFHQMKRSDRAKPLRISSDVTLRRGSDRVEVVTTVENNVYDHRLRVLLPTDLCGENYLTDSMFDVVERPVALPADNPQRRELDVETRPQVTWTAFGDGKAGLAVVSRGLPEVAVLDTPQRPIALTLLRAFRRAVLANDNMGGQIQGTHTFRYWVVPFIGSAPRKDLCLLGQRVNAPFRQADVLPRDLATNKITGIAPRSDSFLQLEGNVVVTSVQREQEKLLVRLFNPNESAEKISLATGANLTRVASVTLEGKEDAVVKVKTTAQTAGATIPAKRIVTLLVE